MATQKTSADLLTRFEGRLTVAELRVVSAARDWCDARSVPLYLVGGSVRDLLLGRQHLDLDLALEGDAVALGQALCERFDAETTVHEHFGTAALAGNGWIADLVRTRTERYLYPGALPVVSPAPIETDLHRRDFTIHALAMPLNGAVAGLLIDPLGGQADLARRVLRVLHDESFHDDPTRILRLGRYAARLGFAVEVETARLARRDASLLPMVSPARITHELDRIFAEPQPEAVLRELDALHALRPIAAALRATDAAVAAFERLRNDGCGPADVAAYLAALAATHDRTAAQQLVERLELRHEEITAVQAAGPAAATLQRLSAVAGSPDPALAAETLANVPVSALRGAGAAAGGSAAALARRFLLEWRHVRPHLRGDDLIALGVPRGPAVGDVLRLLRNATLRGEVTGREQEERFVREWLRRAGRSQGGA